MTASKNQQIGATLIESLVSLVVLAVAVLGMLGVQIRTLMETNVSANRTQAILLIEDLSERIKANPSRYAILNTFADKEISQLTSSTSDCTQRACNASQLANHDLAQWNNAVIRHLPGGRAQTFLSPNDARQLGVLIGWRSKEKTDAEDYAKHFQIPSSSLASGVNCWTGYICHLMYIQP